MRRSPIFPSSFPSGCKGTTRLPGAAKITRKDGALFGPARSISPHKSLTTEAEHQRDDQVTTLPHAPPLVSPHWRPLLTVLAPVAGRLQDEVPAEGEGGVAEEGRGTGRRHAVEQKFHHGQRRRGHLARSAFVAPRSSLPSSLPFPPHLFFFSTLNARLPFLVMYSAEAGADGRAQLLEKRGLRQSA